MTAVRNFAYSVQMHALVTDCFNAWAPPGATPSMARAELGPPARPAYGPRAMSDLRLRHSPVVQSRCNVFRIPRRLVADRYSTAQPQYSTFLELHRFPRSTTPNGFIIAPKRWYTRRCVQNFTGWCSHMPGDRRRPEPDLHSARDAMARAVYIHRKALDHEVGKSANSFRWRALSNSCCGLAELHVGLGC